MPTHIGGMPASSRPSSMLAYPLSSRVGLSPRAADQRLRVVVRVRPPVTVAEASVEERSTVAVDEQAAQVSIATTDESGAPTSLRCTADAVCGPSTNQSVVYSHVRPSVLAAMQGGRGCIMCYGPSGGGKSYTLLRTNIGEWGLAPRAVSEVCAAFEPGGSPSAPCVEMACWLIHEELAIDVLLETSGVEPPTTAHALGPVADSDAATATLPPPSSALGHAALSRPNVGAVREGGTPVSLIDGASWVGARSAREGLLVLQRCHKGRQAAMGRLSATPSTVHTIVLVRTPPLARAATPPPSAGPASPERKSPPPLDTDTDFADSEGAAEGASSAGGLLCLVELAAVTGGESEALSVRALPPDASLDTLQRVLSALGAASSASAASEPSAAVNVNVDAPFFESTLTTLLHDARVLQRGADVSFVACIGPGKAAAALGARTLRVAIAASHARLAPPEPSTPRGLASLVSQLRRQLAHATAAMATSAAFQAADRERLERENASLSAQLRAQLESEAGWRHELEEANARAEQAEAALDAARASGLGGGAETVQAEFAREARVLGLLCRQDGRREQALRLQQRARKLHERALGKSHHEVARDLANIGNCLCDLHRLDAAAAAYRDAYSIDLAKYGADHVHTATDLASIGLVLASQRKWREALPHLESSQQTLSSQLEPTHPNLVAVEKFLAETRERLAAEPQHG